MKLILFALAFVSITAQAAQKSKVKPHILPDATSAEYRALYKADDSVMFAADGVSSAVRLGERNLEWLTYMNSFRPEGQKLQLTKPGDLKGIPIDEPKSYNAATVSKEFDDIEAAMPVALKEVLYSTEKNFPKEIPVDEATYVEWAKKVDKNYQTAVRWKMMVPWLPALEQERQNDLRGFYHLSMKTKNVEEVLRGADSLPQEKKEQIQSWLEQMCMNNEGLFNRCEDVVAKAIQGKKAYELYTKYLPGSQELWDSYFGLENPRNEAIWTTQNPQKMIVPFADPKGPKILDFLKVNIEDEWKWDQWNLTLEFRPSAPVHVEFKAGVTPHVNDLGGDTITMDKNTPLTEWDVQWTIRHEFGHVLGFKDCYLEFYDPKEAAIVNYQLDIENLMCARSGRMQQKHYETLKASYMK